MFVRVHFDSTMPTAFVAGAVSDLGEAFVKLLLKEGYNIYATGGYGNPDPDYYSPYANKTRELAKLGADVFLLNMSSRDDISTVGWDMEYVPIDIFLQIPNVLVTEEEDSLANLERNVQDRESIFKSTFAHLLLTQALLPCLHLASNAKIGIISGGVDSAMADMVKATRGSYARNAANAALDSLFKNLSVDLKDRKIPVVMMDRGDKGQCVGVEEEAKQLWALLQSKGLEDAGKCWDMDGNELPW